MRFLDVKTDFAFKKVFGSENSTEILIDFLNAMKNYKPKKGVMTLFVCNAVPLRRRCRMVWSKDGKKDEKRGLKKVVEMKN